MPVWPKPGSGWMDDEDAWQLGDLDPWEDWRWDHLPLPAEYLLYLRDATTTPTPASPLWRKHA